MYRPYTHGKPAFYEEDWSVTYIEHDSVSRSTPVVMFVTILVFRPNGTR